MAGERLNWAGSGGLDGAWAVSDGDGSWGGDNNGLVVGGNSGSLWTVSGELGDDNVAGDSDHGTVGGGGGIGVASRCDRDESSECEGLEGHIERVCGQGKNKGSNETDRS